MPLFIRGPLSLVGRVLLCAIFLMSAVGNDIPNYQKTVGQMTEKHIPQPELLLAGAIVFLIAGSLSVILGYKARLGATLLLVFLVLATYYFHDFWNLPEAQQEAQMQHFMKNISMMGALLLIVANGPGPLSLDDRTRK